MSTFHNPDWLKKYDFQYTNAEAIPRQIYNSINKKLQAISSDAPEVSIIIAAWNEESRLLAAIASLADNKTSTSIEIIVINNNSTDGTQSIIDRLHVIGLNQPIQGCGPARQLGLDHAKGKFILTADADCIYPENWIEGMMRDLRKPGVVCVYGRYSFIGNKKKSRTQLFLYEKLKDVMANIRHFKRPHMNCVGLSMGFLARPAKKVGFVMRNIRGEDGRMCFDLMKFGRIIQVKNSKLRVWTGTRTLDKDGTIFKALKVRTLKEVKRASDYIKLHPHHDTKTSQN